MSVCVFEREGKGLEDRATNLGFEVELYTADKTKIFSECDAVIAALPNTEHTHKLCDEACFNALEPGKTVFVNVGRGSTVDEEALISHAHKFKGLVLDVFEVEPLSKESELWSSYFS